MHTTREVAARQRIFTCKAADDAAGSAAGRLHLQGRPLLKEWGLRLRRVCMVAADLVFLVSFCPADATACQLPEIPCLPFHLGIVRIARYCLLHCFESLHSS